MPKQTPTEQVASASARPGWYLDGGTGRQRFWDGDAWRQFADERGTTKKRRVVPLWVFIAATAGALIFGSIIGGAGGDPDPTASVEFRALASENRSMASQVEDAESVAADAASDLARIEKERASLETGLSTLEQDRAELDAEIAAVEARELAVAAAEQAAAVPVPAPAPAPVAPPAPTAPSAYYDNCTAARNAGAAPVRTGDPGYGRHLDRDGDGIGCE